MSNPNKPPPDPAKQALASRLVQFNGLLYICLGVLGFFFGADFHPAGKEVWQFVGVASVVLGLITIVIGRRMDPANKTR